MNPHAVLVALADGEPHSGAALAARAGVSRAAVWKQVQQLRAQGLPVLGRAGEGYRLEAPVELLAIDTVRAALPLPARSLLGDLEVVFDVDSTNAALLRRATTAPRGTVLLAERQSAGRGRRGRAWASPPASNLYLSVLWRSERGLASFAGASLAAGVAAAQAIVAEGVDGIGLKWPNDLVAADRKLGGILVELGGEAHGRCHAVVGLGVNLRMPSAAATAIDQPWTDLATLAGSTMPGRNALAGRLVGALLLALERLEHDGLAACLGAWRALDALAGRPVEVRDGGSRVHGIARGVADDGSLELDVAGVRRRFAAGDVSVRAA